MNRDMKQTKQCKFCGKDFIPKSNRQQYCKGPHIRQCPVCGKDYVEDNIENLKRPPVACSYECRKVRREHTSIERYGRKDPGNTVEAREKAKHTFVEKYGCTSPLGNAEIQEKSKKTLMEKYGVDNIAKSAEYVRKRMSTNLERYGGILPFNTEECRKKQQQTMMERYGVPFYIFTDDFYKNHLEKGNAISKINKSVGYKLQQARIQYQFELRLENRSYDICIPDQQVLIEIDPTYTHNSFGNHWDENGLDKYYHRDKSELAEKHGYRCIHVFDWDDIDKIVESLQPKTTLYARKCKIFKIKNEVCDEFLKKHHFQGTCRGQLLCLGLVYCDELVEVMTFGKPRYAKKHDVELLRLCTKPGYRVVGGASKLFKFATDYYGLHNIISYCDRSKFSGQVYEQLDMSLIRKTPPQEVWCDGKNKITANLLRQRGFDQLFHTNYGKGTNNTQLMLEHGWLPVYDCGQLVYEYV